jgi:hypothetical protein
MVDATSPSQAAHAEARFEPTDASPGWILVFAGSLAALGIIVGVVLWWMLRHQLQRPAAIRPPFSLLAPQTGLPPQQPRLEGRVTFDRWGQPKVAAPRAESQYAWVDRPAGIVRIGPQEAMKILAGKLPSQPSPAGIHAWQEAEELPGSSNSGRTLPGGEP